MNDLMTTFAERKSQWIVALSEHLQLSFLSLFIAIAVAVPLAILLSNRKKINEASCR